jgi:hypothetical protein
MLPRFEVQSLRNLAKRLAGANTAISGWNLQPLLFDANVQSTLNARNLFWLIKTA